MLPYAPILLSLAAYVVLVSGETCVLPSNCTVTQCSTGDSPHCLDNLCTCLGLCDPQPDLGRCSKQEDCFNRYENHFMQCVCTPVATLHCIDGQCHCGYPRP
ncbi:uncharacterized protein LOC124120405 [Haliotis rufescens]|uniref:uncharacterized protein LOC124120405 n=1 Tax=Haliotis rufescens TaxID=6454 RepID=UPI001EAFF65B|nr:uncharacterized protein LOC124120405 [Haliotis rufescens]